jgi:hypothetical protein
MSVTHTAERKNSMKWQKTILLVLLAVLAHWIPGEVDAASLRLPAAVYPPGAHIGYRPVLTNEQMDCMWGFVCEGGHFPNFHFRTQDELGRLSGWGQFAGIQHEGRTTMAFELFVSRYNPVSDGTGMPWSEQMFIDLTMAIHAQGYHLDRHNADLLPAASEGRSLVAVQYLGKQDLVVMAAWSGTLEVEGIALYDHRSPAARQTAWGSLALQIHLASTRGL